MTPPRDPIEWEASLPLRQSTPAWRATVKAIYGSDLDAAELALFRELAGREPPPGGASEFLGVIGRRGGKSETIARLAVFEAIHGGHQVALAPGQLGLIPVISPLREQSGEIVRYCHGLAALPQVRPFVDGEPTRDGVRFITGIEVRTMTADAVSLSGPTVVCGIREEWAKAPGDDAAMPDREIDNTLRPALAPVAGAPRRRLIGITSAYICEGIAFETDRDQYGRADADVLVVRGTTEQFNPAIDREWLARERRRVGERVFAREYLGHWQDAAVESWFGADVIERNVDKGRKILEYWPEWRYVAALDLGLRVDDGALTIAHREQTEDDRVITVIDGCWHWPAGSVSMERLVSEAAKIIKSYDAQRRCFADQFHFDSVKDHFAREGVHLQEAPWTSTGGKSKTVRFNSVRVEMLDAKMRLPDDPDLLREFHNLGGRLRRTGTEEIAARVGKDDRVHSAVLAASEILETQPHREKWPGTWTHQDYMENYDALRAGPFWGTHGRWNDLLYYEVRGPYGARDWYPVSYPELRRRVAALKKARQRAA